MQVLGLEEKHTFLVVSSDPQRIELFSDVIQKNIERATIFTASDGRQALFKAENVPPKVMITDLDLPLISGEQLVYQVLTSKKIENISIIVAADLPEKEHFIDEVVTGKIQFLSDLDEESVTKHLIKALNGFNLDKGSDYKLKYLSAKDMLFQEGDPGDCVYIVKRGELRAFKGKDGVILGNIQAGEFVGEMSHLNEEVRSATVVALTDCELIEIPNGTLDMVLFSKPAWAKALVKTLSKRLKNSNSALLKKAT